MALERRSESEIDRRSELVASSDANMGTSVSGTTSSSSRPRPRASDASCEYTSDTTQLPRAGRLPIEVWNQRVSAARPSSSSSAAVLPCASASSYVSAASSLATSELRMRRPSISIAKSVTLTPEPPSGKR